MNVVRYVPIDPPTDEPAKAKVSQWSLGIAMFAAFVLPFLLLAASTRYRLFVSQAKARIGELQKSQFTDVPALKTEAKPHD